MTFQDFANQILDAATHRQWALLAALLLVGGVAAVRWIAPKLHDKIGAFLNTQRGGALLALIGGAAGAVATSLIAGKALNLQLVIGSFSVSFMAIGGWNAFYDLFFPKDGKPVTAMLKKTPPAAPLIVLLAFGVSISGCYCWQAPHVQEPKCVIAHDVVSCGEADALDAAAIAGTILSAFMTNGAISSAVWDAVKQMAINLGFKTGGCFWAKLQEYFNAPSLRVADTARVQLVQSCQNGLADFKSHFAAPGVKFCFIKGGAQVCR
jgi:hypothetical protein